MHLIDAMREHGLALAFLFSLASQAGLPISLQVAARPFAEATCLRIGHTYQLLTSYHLAQPPLQIDLRDPR